MSVRLMCAAGVIGMVRLAPTELDEDDLESIAEALDIFPPTSAGYASKARRLEIITRNS